MQIEEKQTPGQNYLLVQRPPSSYPESSQPARELKGSLSFMMIQRHVKVIFVGIGCVPIFLA